MGIKRNLRLQIILQIALLVSVICTVVSFIGYNTFKITQEQQITSTIEKRNKDAAKLVTKEIQGYIHQVEDIAQRPDICSMNWEIQKEVLIKEARRIGFERFQLDYPNGDVISTTGHKANCADRAFFKQAMSGISNISDVLFARIDLKMVICVSAPIRALDGTVCGVLTGVTSASKLNEILHSIDIDYGGKCFIINKIGQVMAGVNYENVETLQNDWENGDKKIAGFVEAQKRMVSTKSGITEYSQGNEKYILSYSPVNSEEWFLGTVQNKSKAMEAISVLIIKLAVVALIAIIAGILVGLIFGQQLKPLQNLSESITEIASGNADLTKRIPIFANNEIGEVTEGFNQFTEKLQSIVSDIKLSRDSLTDSGEKLNRQSEANSEITAEIISDIDNVKKQILDQNRSVTQTSEIINGISSNISSLESLVENQAMQASNAAEAVKEMAGNFLSVDKSVDKMSESFNSLRNDSQEGISKQNDVNVLIKNIEDQSAMLQEANTVISSIAEQTNLLAMNAAIEAVHAGEAGKGFSVVADEIRKLSETSTSQSRTIGDQLNSIKQSIVTVVDASKRSVEVFESVTQRILDTDNFVRQIKNVISEQTENSKKINEALQSMNSSTQEVLGMSKKMTQDNSEIISGMGALQKASMNMCGSMDSMSESAEKISESESSLASISREVEDSINQISGQIDQFKV